MIFEFTKQVYLSQIPQANKENNIDLNDCNIEELDFFK